MGWLRSLSPLPVVLKGIATAEDTRLAVGAGADAIVVSNHGGRQLDGAPATLDALPAVVPALDGQLNLTMHDLLLKLGAETGQTVVLVTHDLMEAVTLADRVLVCTRRPATVALEQRIGLKRPRDVLNVRFTNEFKELYDTLWERLRVEYHEDRV